MTKKLSNYFKASYGELRKVVWPTRAQALQLTAMVLVVSMILGIYLSLFGYLYQQILQKLIFKV